MKTHTVRILALWLPLAVAALCFAGCFTGCAQGWPKDSYIEKAESTINTPWGPSVQKADVIATGTAANNATRTPAPPKPASP